MNLQLSPFFCSHIPSINIRKVHHYSRLRANRPVFGRRHTNRLGRLSTLQLCSAFHSDRTGSVFAADSRHGHIHGGLDAYFEALQKKQADGETDIEWTQFEFPKRIEWKPSSSTVLADGHSAAPESSDAVSPLSADEAAALAQIDAALEREILARGEELAHRQPSPASPKPTSPGARRPLTPGDAVAPALVDEQSQSYANHLVHLSAEARYVEIPSVFEAMLANGVKPIARAYNALLMAAIHLPTNKIEVVSKALDVYADMVRRRVSPDSDTFDILVGLLASRSLEVSEMKASLEEKRRRFGGIEEPGKFMFTSHELEHAILCEDDRLDLAIKLFDASVDASSAAYSAETYHHLISACARAGRVSDMLRLFGHMETNKVVPCAAVFPAMITAFATRGDLVSAVECYGEYRSLAVADDCGRAVLRDRLDGQVYAAVINAYVVCDKPAGAVKFFKRIVDEYGARAADINAALVTSGFVQGFISRGIYPEALKWAQSIEDEARSRALSRIAIAAADDGDEPTAVTAHTGIPDMSEALTPTIALLAMSIRRGDVASATKYWQILTHPEVHAAAQLIEPTAMFAVALIGSGQVVEGLAQSEMMFQRIRASEPEVGSQLVGEIDEGASFIHRYMESRGMSDPRIPPSPPSSSIQSQTMTGSPFLSTTTTSNVEDSYDPHAQSIDFKGSSLIADDLEGGHGRKGPRLTEAMNRFRNMRRAGRHPRYITYAKLISAAAREGKMELCLDILGTARTDVPLLPQYAAVRYGWSSILDAMVGACLGMGNRGRAEQYHQELLEIGSAPSANTFGLYITTLKESTKTFDEASEAVRIFQRAKSEGVEPSSFLYNALIGKLGKARRIDDCLFYFSEMRALGVRPTSVTYGTIVNALCRVSDEKFAEELFDEMEAMPNYKARPAPYNSMMQFFLTTKRDKSKVLAYYERMLRRKITPTSHTYKLLIDTHATLDPVDMTAAEQVLGRIQASGQRAESVHYASLIHAKGCALHDVAGARKLFDSVVRESLAPVQACLFQALFEGMVANHMVAETEPLLVLMRERRVELTPYIANTLIHGWAAQKRIDKAKAIYDSVSRECREPSTYEAMTRAFLAVEDREQARGVAGEMVTRGYPIAVVNKVLELLGGGHEAAAEY
ncbi:pentatricopeptide repeat protein [Ophiocordyceps camponoti-floridani]|uniref:Pentatricopeptide repeat protein n=1 Tax=Ophiocordyceps camponoti-floridani TaxID=2030778 RepID=A0A8H4VDF3_9HYPO|nr:pentatricopeptide repeat protein [Ophiocordyceps camponoti-floridani]